MPAELQRASDPNPWERQPDETPKAFNAFTHYRDLDPADRCLAVVSLVLYGERWGRKRGAVGRVREWSTRFRWAERVLAWDDFVDRESRRARINAVIEMQKRHRATLAEAWNCLVSAAAHLDWNQITVTQYIRALKALIHSERLVVGQPVEDEKVRHLIETAPSEDVMGVAQDVDISRFELNPEMFATTMLILQQHEHKPEPSPEVTVESDAA
jgi:hypothetical protein